jgi:hypothetical protein
MALMKDEDGVPYGWQEVRMTEEELDAMCDAAAVGDIDLVDAIVEGAYDRLFGEQVH